MNADLPAVILVMLKKKITIAITNVSDSSGYWKWTLKMCILVILTTLLLDSRMNSSLGRMRVDNEQIILFFNFSCWHESNEFESLVN